MDKRIFQTIDGLKKNGFQVEFFQTAKEAKEKILQDISIYEDIGIGGSMTIYDMELHKDLMERGNQVYWHWLVEPDKRSEERRKAGNAKVYLSSSNAITEDGKLVNIDGSGNRVASIAYGHERVYIIAGTNKITKNVDEGIRRIKEIASPRNTKRLNLNTPCKHTGECIECSSKDRICNFTLILDHKPLSGQILVYLIDEELGY